MHVRVATALIACLALISGAVCTFGLRYVGAVLSNLAWPWLPELWHTTLARNGTQRSRLGLLFKCTFSLKVLFDLDCDTSSC